MIDRSFSSQHPCPFLQDDKGVPNGSSRKGKQPGMLLTHAIKSSIVKPIIINAALRRMPILLSETPSPAIRSLLQLTQILSGCSTATGAEKHAWLSAGPQRELNCAIAC